MSPYKDSTRNYIRSLELLLNVSNILAQTLNIDELLSEVIDQIFNLLKRIDRGAILLLDKETGKLQEMVSKTRMGDKEGVFSKINYSRSIVKRTIKTGEPVMMSDTRRVAKAELSDSMEQMNVMSVMCVPLTYKGEVRGVIYVDSIGLPEGFRRDDLHLLTSLSNTTATAIENARLYGAVKQELSERKQAEQNLHQSEEKYRSLFEDSKDAVYITTREGAFIDANQSALELLGYSRDELKGLNAQQLYLNPLDAREFQKEIEKNGFVKDYGVKLANKDGTEMDCLFSVSVRRASDGSTSAYQGIIRDITEQKQAERKLTATLKEKEVLLKEIHHRVKNNMQVISSLLKLQAESIEDETLRTAFRESQNRVRAMALVHEKLYQAKDLAHVPFKDYLQSLIRYLYQSYTPRARNLELSSEIEDLSLDITTAIPCGLILNELLSNAFTHAFPREREGTITVSLRSPEPHTYELTVSDDGIGLPEAIDPKTTKTLGLHLVSILVEDQLRGKVELERGNGTTFRVTFKVQ